MKFFKSAASVAMAALIGALALGAGIASAQSIVTKTGETITKEQIQSFFATNPSEYQIGAQAKAHGLSIEQTAQAWKIGLGYVKNDGNAWQEASFMPMAAHAMGGNFILIGNAPGGGTLVTEQELKAVFASNPDNHTLAVEAAKLGMTIPQIEYALASGRGDPYNQSLQIVQVVNAMTDFAFEGSKIVAGSGPKSDPNGTGRKEFAPGMAVKPDPACLVPTANANPGCLSNDRWLDLKNP